LSIESSPERLGISAAAWGGTVPGTKVRSGDPIVPRRDVDETLERLALENEALEGAAGDGKPAAGRHGDDAALRAAQDGPASGGVKNEAKERSSVDDNQGIISIDDFAKVQLKVAK